MGRDKAFLKIDGVALWRRQLETLRALLPDEVLISGPRHSEWREFEIVTDVQPNAGPLGGIAAALERCRSEFLIVLAVDMPRTSAVFFSSMLGACAALRDGKGIVPKTRNGYEPLAAAYPKRCLSIAHQCIHERCYMLRQFVLRAVNEGLLLEHNVTPDEEPLFSNLNTPVEFDAAVRLPPPQ